MQAGDFDPLRTSPGDGGGLLLLFDARVAAAVLSSCHHRSVGRRIAMIMVHASEIVFHPRAGHVRPTCTGPRLLNGMQRPTRRKKAAQAQARGRPSLCSLEPNAV